MCMTDIQRVKYLIKLDAKKLNIALYCLAQEGFSWLINEGMASKDATTLLKKYMVYIIV